MDDDKKKEIEKEVPEEPELSFVKELAYEAIASVLICGAVMADSVKRFFTETKWGK